MLPISITQFILKFYNNIMDNHDTLLQAFSQISDEILQINNQVLELKETNSQNSLNTLAANLHNQSEIFHRKLENLLRLQQAAPSSSSQVPLSNLTDKCEEIKEKLQVLVTKIYEMQQSLSRLKKDAEIKELIQIIDVKKCDEDWIIKVRSNPSCEENFRNVDIWDVQNNVIVAQFKLIEPKVVVKKRINEVVIPKTYYVARIGDRIVSKPFFLKVVALIEFSYDGESNCLSFILKNLFNEELKDLVIEVNLKPYQIIESLSPNEELEVDLQGIDGPINLQVIDGQNIISDLVDCSSLG